MSKRKWTEEQLKKEVKEASSYRDLARRLGHNNSSGLRKTLDKDYPNLDTSHFTKSCPGSTKYTELLDKRYGMLLVVEIKPPEKKKSYDNNYKCVCKCDCGNYRTYNCSYFQRGLSLSCGCDKKHIYRKHYGVKHKINDLYHIDTKEADGICHILNLYLNKILARSIDKNREFNITTNYILDLLKNQECKCCISGMDICIKKRNSTASLDRIDSSKGYIIGNVQWVHKDINRMKTNFSEEYFIEICEKVSKYRKKII